MQRPRSPRHEELRVKFALPESPLIQPNGERVPRYRLEFHDDPGRARHALRAPPDNKLRVARATVTNQRGNPSLASRPVAFQTAFSYHTK